MREILNAVHSSKKPTYKAYTVHAVHTHIYTRMCTHTHTHTHARTHAHAHVNTQKHAPMHAHTTITFPSLEKQWNFVPKIAKKSFDFTIKFESKHTKVDIFADSRLCCSKVCNEY